MQTLSHDTNYGAHRRHFHGLTQDAKREAIRRLAREGFSDHGISHATGLSVEMVRQILGAPPSYIALTMHLYGRTKR